MGKKKYKIVVKGSDKEQQGRSRLLEHFKNCGIPDDQLLVNLGLYFRSTLVAKTLYLNELYQRILPVPGIIMEFGVWWGANMAMMMNFRNVCEPYNYTRKIVGFDTFEGYPSVSANDGSSQYAEVGGYAVPADYEAVLDSVLDSHEQDNVMSHIKKHELVRGDVTKTLDKYLKKNAHTIIALAYFDLALYEPTKHCLKAIRPYMVPGSIIAMDELNDPDFPGETVAFREVFAKENYEIVRSKYLPDRAFIVLK